jgi:hypothetical protein
MMVIPVVVVVMFVIVIEATACCTHSSVYLQVFDPHLLAASDFELKAAASGTGVEISFYGKGLATYIAISAGADSLYFKSRPLQQSPLRRCVETEFESFRNYSGKSADLQANGCDPSSGSALFADLHYTLSY